jgi:AP endonuclease 2
MPDSIEKSEINGTLTTSIPTETGDTEPFIDPEASKESWTKLFSRKPPPRCEHGEPCKSFTTKKKGENCGRMFWLCARYVENPGMDA